MNNSIPAYGFGGANVAAGGYGAYGGSIPLTPKTHEQNFIVAADFVSDRTGRWSCNWVPFSGSGGVNVNPLFPEANLKDDRFDVPMQTGGLYPLPSAYGDVWLLCDFGKLIPPAAFVAILSHNLWRIGNIGAYIGTSPDGSTWTDCDITNLTGPHAFENYGAVVGHRSRPIFATFGPRNPHAAPWRYLRLRLTRRLGWAAAPDAFVSIGRFIVASWDDCVQPRYQASTTVKAGESRIGEGKPLVTWRPVANPQIGYNVTLDLSQQNIGDARDNQNSLQAVWWRCHQTRPALLFVFPSRVPVLAPVTADNYPRNKYAYYAWPDDSKSEWSSTEVVSTQAPPGGSVWGKKSAPFVAPPFLI